MQFNWISRKTTFELLFSTYGVTSGLQWSLVHRVDILMFPIPTSCYWWCALIPALKNFPSGNETVQTYILLRVLHGICSELISSWYQLELQRGSFYHIIPSISANAKVAYEPIRTGLDVTCMTIVPDCRRGWCCIIVVHDKALDVCRLCPGRVDVYGRLAGPGAGREQISPSLGALGAHVSPRSATMSAVPSWLRRERLAGVQTNDHLTSLNYLNNFAV